MKKRNLENENLESEVNNLIDKIESLGGNIDNLSISYDDYNNLKNHYKKNKKHNNKVMRVRNLKITGNVLLLSLPFILALSSYIGFFVYGLNNANDNYEKQYNQYSIVSMDNSGNFSEKLEKKKFDDYIEVETAWFEENGVYVQYKYKAKHDFKTKEELEEVVNSDSFDLLKKYSFSQEDKLVMKKADDREIDINEKDKIKVKAGVKCSKEEFEKLYNDFETKLVSVLLPGLVGVLAGAISWGVMFLIFNLDSGYLKGNIKCAKGVAADNLIDKRTLRDEKKKMKAIKKKFK